MGPEIFQKRIVYQIPGMEKIEPHRGLSFGSAGQEGLGMDVYVPPGLPDGSRVPGVLLIHGGPGRGLGKTPRSWGVFQSYGELIAASGLVALMPDHRYHSWGALEQSTGDLQAALLHARERAADFQLDPDRLALWAFSGGGVLLTTFLRDRPEHVRCLLAFYPILDLEPLQDKDRAPELTDDLAQRFSLASGLAGNGSPMPAMPAIPPLLVARAGLDSPLLNQGVDRFVEAALAANAPLELINHPRGRHGFDILDDDPRSRAILARAIDFLKTWL